MSPLYQTTNTQSGEAECALYEATPENVYQYVDADHKTADPPPKDFTYDSAVADGPMNNNDETRREDTPEDNKELQDDREEQIGETEDTSQSTKRLPHKYHVLEGP